MSYRLDVRPEARWDMIEAATWYNQKRAGLGGEFSAIVQAAIDSLAENPSLYRIRARHGQLEVRWIFPKRFPYRVAYYVRGNGVTIFAVAHTARDERAWKERL